MKILLAPNAFKESLSAPQAARAMARGCRACIPEAEIVELPVADGGDGTVEALAASLGGRLIRKTVADPLGRKVRAKYAYVESEKKAVIEMAEASGLKLLEPKQRNPLKTSTFGTGELILDAVKRGARHIILGIGGSATVDCGAGVAQALGVRLLDQKGRDLAPGGGQLENLHQLDLSNTVIPLDEIAIQVACDVDNPLLGKRGGIQVYSPQKGASKSKMEKLEQGARQFAKIAKRDLQKDIAKVPGAGAAGGLGAGLLALLNAEMRPGIELVLDAVKFSERAANADLILTGEGKIDGQTIYGKAPAGVARAARELGVPCVAICGAIGPGAERLYDIGITSIHSICNAPMELSEAMDRAEALLRSTTENVIRLWWAGGAP